MPYLIEDQRYYLLQNGLGDLAVSMVAADIKEFKGMINYINHFLVKTYLRAQEKDSYFITSTAINGVEDAADELRRRLLHRFEDGAIKRNGDI